MIFLHFILVLPSPFALGVPNAKVGLTKTAKSEGIFWLAQVLCMLLPLTAMCPLNFLEIRTIGYLKEDMGVRKLAKPAG